MNLEGGEQTKRKATLDELATLVGGKVAGDPFLAVTGIAGLEEAGEGEITFLAELKNLSRLEKTRAAAAVVPLSLPTFSKPVIRAPNPYLAYAKIQAFFAHQPYRPKGVDPRAHIGQGAKIGQEVSIYPFVFIGDGCQIGDRVVLYPGVYVGEVGADWGRKRPLPQRGGYESMCHWKEGHHSPGDHHRQRWVWVRSGWSAICEDPAGRHRAGR